MEALRKGYRQGGPTRQRKIGVTGSIPEIDLTLLSRVSKEESGYSFYAILVN